jgi:hypothetical protein
MPQNSRKTNCKSEAVLCTKHSNGNTVCERPPASRFAPRLSPFLRGTLTTYSRLQRLDIVPLTKGDSRGAKRLAGGRSHANVHLYKERTLSLSNSDLHLSGSLRCRTRGLLVVVAIFLPLALAHGQSRLTLTCSPATGPTQVGVAYSAGCTASGGITPYQWSISGGALPSGLAMSSSPNGVTISGAPKVSGDFSYSVQVSDGGRSAASCNTGLQRSHPPGASSHCRATR